MVDPIYTKEEDNEIGTSKDGKMGKAFEGGLCIKVDVLELR